jgi:hypothetical protein
MLIYNDDGQILFKTQRPYELDIDINVELRSARKLMFNKHDCFEIKTDADNTYLLRNGKDLYIHNSVIDVIAVEEKESLKCHGETNYKDVYTLKFDEREIKVESDYYTRKEKTDERLYREKLANIISECMYSGKEISHYEVERLLEKLDITIKE